jgi:5'/3'-nucleotidase SurE
MAKRMLAVVAGLALALGPTVAVDAAGDGVGAGVGAGERWTPPGGLDILLTNDDGWRGPGGSDTPLIVALRDHLEAAGHHVVVVAPGTDQSGQGGRVTLPGRQVEVANPEPDVWTVTPGSPADSVFFGLDEIFAGEPPDLVISGMNPGNNMTAGIIHSGTVNAALTALEHGVPSLAVSVEQPSDWPGAALAASDQAAGYVVDLVDGLGAGRPLPDDTGLNVNYPVRPGPIDPATGLPGSVLAPRGTRATAVGGGVLVALDYTASGGQGPGLAGSYTVGLGTASPDDGPGTDFRAVEGGFVSISALEADHDTDPATSRWLRDLVRDLD